MESLALEGFACHSFNPGLGVFLLVSHPVGLSSLRFLVLRSLLNGSDPRLFFAGLCRLSFPVLSLLRRPA